MSTRNWRSDCNVPRAAKNPPEAMAAAKMPVIAMGGESEK
jgi:hypothetical protein